MMHPKKAIYSRQLKIQSSRGASAIEASIVLLLLMLLLAVFIDLFRFFYTHNLVSRVALTAARDFSKGDIALDLSNEACEADPSSCTAMLNFLTKSEQLVHSLLNGRIAPSGSGSSTHLVKYSYFRQGDHDPHHIPHSLVAGATYDIALIRPGEAVYELRDSGQEFKIAHPIRPDYISGRDNASDFPRATGAGWPHFTTVTWEDALREYPTIAIVGVEFRFLFMPFSDSFVIRASHASFKNSAKQSHLVRSTGENIVPTRSPYGGGAYYEGLSGPPPEGAPPVGVCAMNSCELDTCFCSNNPRSDFCRFCPLDACALDCG